MASAARIPTRGGKRAPYIVSPATRALIESLKPAYEAAIGTGELPAGRVNLNTHRRDGSARWAPRTPPAATAPAETPTPAPSAAVPAIEVVTMSETLTTGARLRALRLARGWSENECRRRAGVSRTALHHAEMVVSFTAGRCHPRSRRCAEQLLATLLAPETAA